MLLLVQEPHFENHTPQWNRIKGHAHFVPLKVKCSSSKLAPWHKGRRSVSSAPTAPAPLPPQASSPSQVWLPVLPVLRGPRSVFQNFSHGGLSCQTLRVVSPRSAGAVGGGSQPALGIFQNDPGIHHKDIAKIALYFKCRDKQINTLDDTIPTGTL